MIPAEWKVRHIADLIKESKSTVVFTGAGISTESGIPDFRSKGGLWDGKNPMEISHVKMVHQEPRTLFGFYAERQREFESAEPNKAHYILSKWERKGLISGIVTQNIDGYHKWAGSKTVVELHGDMRVRCSYCNQMYNPVIYDRHNPEITVRCTRKDVHGDNSICNGVLRPNVVLFGEDLSDTNLYDAYRLHDQADLCIIIGSSCKVAPANSLPTRTAYSGGKKGKVVIINKGETDLDYLASYKVDEWGASLTLDSIDKALRGEF